MGPESSQSKLFISSLPSHSRTKDLIEILRSYAKVKSVTLARKKNNNKQTFCSGYGFIVCDDAHSAAQLMEASQQVSICYQGKALVIRQFRSGQDLYQKRKKAASEKIFVSNIPVDSTRQEIEKIFSVYGSLKDVLVKDQPESSPHQGTRIAHVTYDSVSSAIQAFENGDQIQINGHPLNVDYYIQKLSKSKKSKDVCGSQPKTNQDLSQEPTIATDKALSSERDLKYFQGLQGKPRSHPSNPLKASPSQSTSPKSQQAQEISKQEGSASRPARTHISMGVIASVTKNHFRENLRWSAALFSFPEYRKRAHLKTQGLPNSKGTLSA